VAYTTFIGRDGQQASFSWVTQKIGGIDASVLVLDVNGAPLSTANPLPITAPSNLPVAIQGTPSVTISGTPTVAVSGTLQTLTPPDGSPLTTPTSATVGVASATMIAQNLSRKRIDVSNSSTTAQVWIRPGSGTAAVGLGWLLPPQAQASYYTTAALIAISTVAATAVGIVEW
jgi:hypothetical protein